MRHKISMFIVISIAFMLATTAFASDKPIMELRECSGPNTFFGSVMTPDDDYGVPMVLINIEGECEDEVETDDTGAYIHDSIADGDFILTPSKFGDQNGISSFDAAYVAQYSAGMIDFDEYQMIAGDVTGDGGISTFDAARIAQFSAGMIDEFPAGDWAFSPESAIEVDLSGGEEREVNFVGITIGDVTMNWEPSTSIPTSGHKMSQAVVNSQYQEVNDLVTVPLTVNQLPENDVVAFDIVMTYDPTVIAFEGIKTEGNLAADWTIFVNNNTPGIVKIASYHIMPLVSTGKLIDLNFKRVNVGEPGVHVAEFALNEDQIVVETKSNQTNVAVVAQSALTQNYPNPFNPITTIAYDVMGGSVSLAVYSLEGKLVRTLVDENLSAGTYQIQWDGTNNQGQTVSSGIYLYKLDTNNYTETRSMILMK